MSNTFNLITSGQSSRSHSVTSAHDFLAPSPTASPRTSSPMPQAMDAATATTHIAQAEPTVTMDPIEKFAEVFSDSCELESDSSETQAITQQINYVFNEGAILPSTVFKGLQLPNVISSEPIDALNLKLVAAREQVKQQLTAELTGVLLSCCDQPLNPEHPLIPVIADARREFIASGRYLDKLLDGNAITEEDITVLRRLCQLPAPEGFDSIAFIQQFTDAAHGFSGSATVRNQCGADEDVQMQTTLHAARIGNFHQRSASVNYLETEIKLAALHYCERILSEAMHAAGHGGENRREFDRHLKELCATGRTQIDHQSARIDVIAMAQAVVEHLSTLFKNNPKKIEAELIKLFDIPNTMTPQDILLLRTEAQHPIGKALCENLISTAAQTAIHPTVRSVIKLLMHYDICIQSNIDSDLTNHEHLADLFHQMSAFEPAQQKACYEALSQIPLLDFFRNS